MSGIKRWKLAVIGSGLVGMDKCTDGVFVNYEDHAAEIARLRAELEKSAKAALDAVALACEKEREADALRVDAMRYRWLRDLPQDHPSEEIGNMPGDMWDEMIDAAMGADE